MEVQRCEAFAPHLRPEVQTSLYMRPPRARAPITWRSATPLPAHLLDLGDHRRLRHVEPGAGAAFAEAMAVSPACPLPPLSSTASAIRLLLRGSTAQTSKRLPTLCAPGAAA